MTHLSNDVNISLPLPQSGQSSIKLSASTLQYEDAVLAENVLNVTGIPHARGTEGLNQVSTSEEHNFGALACAVGAFDAAHDVVYFVVKVIKHASGGNVGRALSLPRVDHEPFGCIFGGELAHANSMASGGEAALLVCV